MIEIGNNLSVVIIVVAIITAITVGKFAPKRDRTTRVDTTTNKARADQRPEREIR